MHGVLKGELVTAGLRARLCCAQGGRFHPEAMLCLLKHAQGRCSSAYSPHKKTPEQQSSPVQQSLGEGKWLPFLEQHLVQGAPGPFSSKHPVLSHLCLPSECAGTSLPGFKCLLGIKGFS